MATITGSAVTCCRLRSDTLLGVASVSLATLLQECWVDGYAPVYALMTKAAGGQEQEEKVQVSSCSVDSIRGTSIAATQTQSLQLLVFSFQLLCHVLWQNECCNVTAL